MKREVSIRHLGILQMFKAFNFVNKTKNVMLVLRKAWFDFCYLMKWHSYIFKCVLSVQILFGVSQNSHDVYLFFRLEPDIRM